MINRREFFKKTAWGTTAFALAPSFNHLLAAPAPQLAPVMTNGFPHRFVFIRKSNGNLPEQFGLNSFSSDEKSKHDKKQAFELDLDKHELPDWLKALDPYKEHMTILHGISMSTSGGGHYSFSGCLGSFKAGRNILSNIKRATVDFELAKLFPSPYGHVEMSLASVNGTGGGIVSGMSAPAAQQRNYCYADPMTAYNELFKTITNTEAVASDSSLLNYLFDQESRRLSSLNGEERMKISDQVDSLQSIRERNTKVAALSDVIKKHLPKIDPVHADGGLDATMPQKQAAFTDVIVAALATGLTNVVTYTIDDLETKIDTLPENEEKTSIHAVGHGMGPSSDRIRSVMQTYHMKQVETLVTKLKAIPEGNGTMFDNTMIMYFPEGGETHHGFGLEAPFVILAGNNCNLDMTGRYFRLPYHATEGHKTIGNWYTSLLNAHGNPIKHYGDLDLEMSHKKLPQTGYIREFMA